MPRKLIKDIRKFKYVYLMLIPVLAYYIIFCYVPMGGLIMAFKDYAPRKGIFGSDWVGFKYFLDFFNDMYFVRLMRNTFMLNVYDIIVGFPGESQSDFETTVAFAKEVGFAQLHVFKYSKRNGTVAAKMPNQIEEKEKSKRSEVLIQAGLELTKKYREGFVGKKETVLFEEVKNIDGREYYVGHTKNYIEVAIESREDVSGKILKVEIKDFINHEIMLATR